MCVKLQQNGKIIIPGSIIEVKTKQGLKSLVWGINNPNGIYNARMESLEKLWLPKGYKIGTAIIEKFVERDTTYTFETKTKDETIGVLYKGNEAIIITEPATGSVVRVHHRQPCFVKLKDILNIAA